MSMGAGRTLWHGGVLAARASVRLLASAAEAARQAVRGRESRMQVALIQAALKKRQAAAPTVAIVRHAMIAAAAATTHGELMCLSTLKLEIPRLKVKGFRALLKPCKPDGLR